jgi:hypothetical protein
MAVNLVAYEYHVSGSQVNPSDSRWHRRIQRTDLAQGPIRAAPPGLM